MSLACSSNSGIACSISIAGTPSLLKALWTSSRSRMVRRMLSASCRMVMRFCFCCSIVASCCLIPPRRICTLETVNLASLSAAWVWLISGSPAWAAASSAALASYSACRRSFSNAAAWRFSLRSARPACSSSTAL